MCEQNLETEEKYMIDNLILSKLHKIANHISLCHCKFHLCHLFQFIPLNNL